MSKSRRARDRERFRPRPVLRPEEYRSEPISAHFTTEEPDDDAFGEPDPHEPPPKRGR